MILHYRFPFDVPSMGAHAGDYVCVDAITGTVEITKALPASVMGELANLIPRLRPVGSQMPSSAASALVAALAPTSRPTHLRVVGGGGMSRHLELRAAGSRAM